MSVVKKNQQFRCWFFFYDQHPVWGCVEYLHRYIPYSQCGLLQRGLEFILLSISRGWATFLLFLIFKKRSAKWGNGESQSWQIIVATLTYLDRNILENNHGLSTQATKQPTYRTSVVKKNQENFLVFFYDRWFYLEFFHKGWPPLGVTPKGVTPNKNQINFPHKNLAWVVKKNQS